VPAVFLWYNQIYMNKYIVVGLLLVAFTLPNAAQAFSFGEMQSTLRNLIVEIIAVLRGQSEEGYTVVLPTTSTSTATTTEVTPTTPPVVSPVGPVVTPVTKTADYTLSDVKSVTKRVVDSIPSAIDDEYTEYVITLKNGTVVTVDEVWFAPRDMQVKAFRDSGYIGDIDALIKLSTTAVAQEGLKVNVSAKTASLTATLSQKSGEIATVCGPTKFGTVTWGDGVSETVYGLGCSANTQAIPITHTYKNTGSYTITVSDNAGNTETAKITVR
jgi:hypothetical protein